MSPSHSRHLAISGRTIWGLCTSLQVPKKGEDFEMQSITARGDSGRFFAHRIGALLGLALLLAAPRVSAQSLAGLAAISGTVRDPSSAPIGEAVVTVANRSIG